MKEIFSDKETILMSDVLVDSVDMSDFYSKEDFEPDFMCVITTPDKQFVYSFDHIKSSKKEYKISFSSDSELVSYLLSHKKIESIRLVHLENTVKEFKDIEDIDVEVKMYFQHSHQVILTIPNVGNM